VGKRHPITGIIPVIVLGAVVFYANDAVLHQVATLGNWSDYQAHALAARDWWRGQSFHTPHFLFAALTIFCKLAFRTPGMGLAALIAGDLSAVAAALATYWFWLRYLPVRNRRDVFIAVTGCLALQFVGPINLMTAFQKNLYLGYVYPANIYHNPTIVLLKPLALLSLALTVDSLERSAHGGPGWRLQFAVGAIAVLSACAKPSWLVTYLPALVVTVLLDSRFRHRWAAWKVVLAAFGPGLAILSWQYAFLYADPENASIVVTPVKWVSNLGAPACAKVILSSAYPLAVLLAYRRSVQGSTMLRLSWSAFGVGLLLRCALSETGQRAAHGNVGWSAQISLFILFVVSTITMLKALRQPFATRVPSALSGIRLFIIIFIFALHLAGGLAWYGTYLAGQGKGTWY
jgi:hypothetical protein